MAQGELPVRLMVADELGQLKGKSHACICQQPMPVINVLYKSYSAHF